MVTRYRPHLCRSRLSQCDNLRLNEEGGRYDAFTVFGLLSLLVLTVTSTKVVNGVGESRSLKICCVFRLLESPEEKNGLEAFRRCKYRYSRVETEWWRWIFGSNELDSYENYMEMLKRSLPLLFSCCECDRYLEIISEGYEKSNTALNGSEQR